MNAVGRGLGTIAVATTLWWTAAAAPIDAAQETITSASVSGRVTDPQNRTVPGAQVVAHRMQTNVTSETVTDQDGRFRFPYLKVGPYEIRVHLDGFKDATRRLTLTVGSAFDLPIPIAVAGLDTTVTVTGEATVLEAARSQIAGTVSETEVQSVPMNGRNFLDLALSGPRRVADQRGEHAAVCRDIRSARRRTVRRQPAQLLQQLHRRWLVGERRCRRFERHAVRRRRRRPVSGRDVGRAGGAGTGARRLHQRRDEEWHQRRPWRSVRLRARRHAQRGERAVRHDAADASEPVRRQLRRSAPARSQLLFLERRAAAARSIRPGHDRAGQRGRDQRAPRRRRLSGFADLDRCVREPRAQHEPGRQDRPPAERQRSSQHSVRVVRRDVREFTGCWRAERAQRIGRPRQHRSDRSVQQHPESVGADSQRNAGAGRLQRSRGAADRSGRACGQHRRRRVVRHPVGEPDASTQQVVRARRQSLASGGRPRASRGRGCPLQRRHHHVSAINPRRVHVFVTGELFGRRLQQRGVHADVRRDRRVANESERRCVRAGRVEGRPAPDGGRGHPLRSAVPADDLQRREQRVAAPRLRLVAVGGETNDRARQRGALYDRVPLRALANALLSAGNTTDLASLQQNSISLSPTQAGAPAFPGILAAPISSVTLANLTTMDRDMQNAYSRQAGLEVEQQVGDRSTISLGYQYTRGTDLIISVNQNVPTCVASGTNNGCRPNSAYANNSQYSPLAESSYHGLHASFVQRPARWGYYRVSYTLSKAMDNVGEFFFSSPIDPFDLSKDWGRSDDDQRHRLVVNGAVNSPTDPGRTAWDRLTHGFQVSGTLQYYSALPFNITSGVTTLQGTAGRPTVNGVFIERNAGTGPDFFSLNARVSRTFSVAGRVRVEGLVEAFNLTNRVNVVTVNGNFGAGAYPMNPSPTFGQITAVGDPRAVQLGVRLKF